MAPFEVRLPTVDMRKWRLQRNVSAMKCAAKVAVYLAVVVVATVSPLVTPVAAQLFGNRARPQVTRPSGPVWQVIRRNCTGCHGIDDYAFFALDRAGWQSLIETKHEGSQVGMSTQDLDILLDWLVSTFGPDSTPFPRRYIPPEITTLFTDPEANRLLNRACVQCHDLKQVNESRFPADQWRVILAAMRQRGAVLTDEELEKMVEWLGRTKGINAQQQARSMSAHMTSGKWAN